jgi:hypothetical protein
MQKLKPGDKVRFVDEPLEGIITSVQPNQIFGVTIEEDFEIPVHGSKLVKINFEPVVAVSDHINEKPKPPSNHPLGIFAAFNRTSEQTVQLLVHNNIAAKIYMVCYNKEEDVYKLAKHAVIERGETLALDKYELDQFDSWKPWRFQFLLLEPTMVNLAKPIDVNLQFNAKVFHNSLKYCFFTQNQAYVFRLDEAPVSHAHIQKLKDKDFTEITENALSNLLQKPQEVVDLHYEKLLTKGYKPTADITALQMQVFRKSLEAAYVHRMKYIVFIHGVGTQYLKNKIHTELKKQHGIVSEFYPADELKYGAGATMVVFK